MPCKDFHLAAVMAEICRKCKGQERTCQNIQIPPADDLGLNSLIPMLKVSKRAVMSVSKLDTSK